MKVGIFDPYLDTLGGGERYMLTIAEYLAGQGHQVDVFWDDETLKLKMKERLGIDLGRVNFIEDIFYSKKNLPKKWKITRRYDLIFYLSDGSIPFLFAKKNILHFQVPLKNVKGRAFLNRIKFKLVDKVICNSKFTKKFIDGEYGLKSIVVYPPVDVESFTPGRKENIILSVGRFSQALHAKKQEVLIEEFRQLINSGLGDWQLILTGGAKEKDYGYLEELKKKAKGSPVKFFVNADFPTLKKLYGKAKIFWHATGFGENETKYPERMEHFGITTVEAMAAGCVPVVINRGGIPEVVSDKVDGFLWQTKEELKSMTLQLIESPKLTRRVSVQAIKSSKRFSKEVFCQKINEII